LGTAEANDEDSASVRRAAEAVRKVRRRKRKPLGWQAVHVGTRPNHRHSSVMIDVVLLLCDHFAEKAGE
jgi:hypothetical protein